MIQGTTVCRVSPRIETCLVVNMILVFSFFLLTFSLSTLESRLVALLPSYHTNFNFDPCPVSGCPAVRLSSFLTKPASNLPGMKYE